MVAGRDCAFGMRGGRDGKQCVDILRLMLVRRVCVPFRFESDRDKDLRVFIKVIDRKAEHEGVCT